MYFFYPLIAALDGHDGITYILKHIPYQLRSRYVRVLWTWTQQEIISLQDEAQQRFQQPLTGAPRGRFKRRQVVFRTCLLELLVWLDVLQERVEGLRDAIKGTSPLHQGSSAAAAPDVPDHNVRSAGRQRMPPSTYDRESTVKVIRSKRASQAPSLAQ